MYGGPIIFIIMITVQTSILSIQLYCTLLITLIIDVSSIFYSRERS